MCMYARRTPFVKRKILRAGSADANPAGRYRLDGHIVFRQPRKYLPGMVLLSEW